MVMAERNSNGVALNERRLLHMDGPIEYWRDIPGWSGFYRISDWGRIKSLARWVRLGKTGKRLVEERILNFHRSEEGYLHVALCNSNTKLHSGVHRLVLLAFDKPCPEGMQCRHLDGKPWNNHLENLCWGTPAEDHEDRRRHGTLPIGEMVYNSLLEDKDIPAIHFLHKLGETAYQIGNVFGVDKGCIIGILRDGHYKTAHPTEPAVYRKEVLKGERHGMAQFITFNGRTKILKDWAAEIGVTAETLHGRILNWGVEKALSTPRKRRYFGRRK